MDQYYRKRKPRSAAVDEPLKRRQQKTPPPTTLNAPLPAVLEPPRTLITSLQVLQGAVDALALIEPRLVPLVQEHGLPLRLIARQPCTGAFPALAKAVLHQQLAGAAAAKIYERFLATCEASCHEALTPHAVIQAGQQRLRSAGLSERKASYVLDLADKFVSGALADEKLSACSDAELLSALTVVRGVGPWTVHMLQIFHLGHADCLPVGDLGIRKGLQALLKLRSPPSPAEMEALTTSWRPWRSVACWYLWRIQDAPPRKPGTLPAGGAGKRRQQPTQDMACGRSTY